MKKGMFVFLLSLTTLLFSNIAFSQIRKIPSQATESLKQKYPAADKVEWKDAISHFTAKFQLDSKDYEAHFDNDGNWKESLVKIDESEIPESVKDGIAKSKYSDWTLGKIEKIESTEDRVQYRVQVKKGDIKKKILYYNREGKLTKDNITLWF
ncbi:MAG TPA: PepSY-like domain-containing protein [Chitinophagaceae bacterium]|nr:PepSY-like domain-containing protein [Chitinophagaceae bacterium]